MKFKRKHLKVAAIAALVLIAAGYIAWHYYSGGTVTPPGPEQYDAFAKCLTQKGITMYGLVTCLHCAEQKAMFGSSFQYVTYVECSTQQALCSAKGVQFVPSWEINGTVEVGVKALAALSAETGCPLS
ncbi:MAG: hypothetical protein NT016_00405 [Candidatus Aenigmarchaeota archaeon]|nr:hypothetical protein [Candidatus Aenigmarchaeota archaeon]